ncbi:M23 family metallopeptidase [Bacillus sp. B15-48]|uniref:M23 family metallopeptidase n=1 Tax=Bacillus sp. B15-48 TaxID=1548601 RepID=UPI00193F1113|nr:M23 family metallopeptidase [Bacillus sp. B15-48]MBM4761510.1 peptidoglycan DD-metalloendopeptidase family protein [Bacillus sp. B15-48]
MREEKSSQEKSFKRFFKKRWAYPAVYLASAAIILTGVIWFQNSGEQATDQLDEVTEQSNREFSGEPAVEVNRSLENFVMPVADVDSAVIKMQFYDNDMDKAEQEAAIVVYNNQYHPNTGIAIGANDDEEFNVIASLSGEVITVKEDSLLGNVIEINHDNGIVTQYQSIKNIQVKAGDMVEQGDTIATAGTSQFNEKAGVHVHFEIRKDGVPVNPLDYFDKPLSALEEVDPGDSGKNNAGTDATKDDSATEEDESKTEDEESTNNESSDEEDETSNEEEKDEDSSTEDNDSSTNTTETSNS